MPLPSDEARDAERRFFEVAGARRTIRVAARALIILDNRILLQRLAYEGAIRFFPGGELEFGETLEDGLHRELSEELSREVDTMTYRLAANNRFRRNGGVFHLLEHYFEVKPISNQVESLEPGVLVEWHPIETVGTLDLRPWGVRDLLGLPDWRDIRLLEVN